MKDYVIAITGLGIYSSIGTDKISVSQSLLRGVCGIIDSESRREMGYHSSLCGNVKCPPMAWQEKAPSAAFSEAAIYGYQAMKQAIFDAKLKIPEVNNIGLIVSNDSVSGEYYNLVKYYMDNNGLKGLPPECLFKGFNSNPSMLLAQTFGLQGVNLTVSAACAGGLHAIGMAKRCIEAGDFDTVIVVGVQETNDWSMFLWDRLRMFATGDAATACRPFDVKRSGLVPSGGGAAIILQKKKKSESQGYATLCGYGCAGSNAGVAMPSMLGSLSAMQKAIVDSGINPCVLDYINAHATGTVAGDLAEASAIDTLLGRNKPYISSTKAMTGHECWMSGVSCTIYTLLMMEGGFVAPNLNFSTPDPELPDLNIPSNTVYHNIRYAMVNAFGFGGTNASIILKHEQGKI